MKKVLSNNYLMLKYIVKFCPNHIVVSIVNSILTSVMSVISILFLRFIIDSITNHGNIRKMIISILLITGLNIVYSFLNVWMQQKIIPRNTQILGGKMQLEIMKKSLQVDYECYEDVGFYDKYAMALQQADARALAVLNTFTTLLGNLFSIGALVTLISNFEPLIIILVILNVILTFMFNSKVIKIQHDYYEEKNPILRELAYDQRVFYQRDFSKELRLNHLLPDIIIKKYNTSNLVIIKLIKYYGSKLSNLLIIQNIISVIINSSITLYLAYRTICKVISVADFVAVSNSAQQLMNQIIQMVSIIPQMYEHSMYIENFNNFINYVPKINLNDDGIKIENVINIRFNNVSFNYPNSNKKVLSNINMLIKQGEKIAFVGRNGVGKSTLVKLLTRLYDPTNGDIIIDDHNYLDCNLKSIRDKISIIFQDFEILAITIAENILMRPISNIEEDEQIIYDALILVGLYEKVISLPKGIYTVMTKEFDNQGAILSGGEMQKLAIARLYVKKSKVLIMDEPSSSLDSISANEIINEIISITREETVIIISHRLSHVKNVDRIYFLEKGEIIESGTHDELIQKQGEYARMFLLQASNYL